MLLCNHLYHPFPELFSSSRTETLSSKYSSISAGPPKPLMTTILLSIIHYKERKLVTISYKQRCKDLQQNLGKLNPTAFPNDYLHGQAGFILGMQG